VKPKDTIHLEGFLELESAQGAISISNTKDQIIFSLSSFKIFSKTFITKKEALSWALKTSTLFKQELLVCKGGKSVCTINKGRLKINNYWLALMALFA